MRKKNKQLVNQYLRLKESHEDVQSLCSEKSAELDAAVQLVAELELELKTAKVNKTCWIT